MGEGRFFMRKCAKFPSMKHSENLAGCQEIMTLESVCFILRSLIKCVIFCNWNFFYEKRRMDGVSPIKRRIDCEYNSIIDWIMSSDWVGIIPNGGSQNGWTSGQSNFRDDIGNLCLCIDFLVFNKNCIAWRKRFAILVVIWDWLGLGTNYYV